MLGLDAILLLLLLLFVLLLSLMMEHWGQVHISVMFAGLSLTSGGSTCANAGQYVWTHHFLHNI